MNQLILSNKELSYQYSDCSNLSEVIQKVEENGWADGKVICGITVNGIKLSEEDEKKFQQSSISEINKIEFQLNNVNSVVESTIKSLLE